MGEIRGKGANEYDERVGIWERLEGREMRKIWERGDREIREGRETERCECISPSDV
jgi:hypothetical protein